MLAFASLRQPRSLKERYMVQPYNNTKLTMSDIYLNNIEKMSKSRNNQPNYVEGLEKTTARTRRKHKKQLIPETQKSIIIPIGIEIPRMVMNKRDSKPMPKMSESTRFPALMTRNPNFSHEILAPYLCFRLL